MKDKTKKIQSLISLIKCKITDKNIPLFAAVGVTNKCNYRCVYCYGDYYNQTQENFTTTELIKIIDELAGMGTRIINLIGGEPLLRDDLGQLIDRVNNHGIICTVSTNSSLAPQKINSLKTISYLDTSLDGLEKNNDKNRGTGTFKKTMAGIKCAISNGIKTNVNMVLTKYNMEDIDAMVKLAKEIGFTVSFNLVFESHSHNHSNYSESKKIKNKNDQAIKTALKKIIDYKKEGYPIRFSQQAYEYALNWPLPYSDNVYTEKTENLGSFKPIKCLFTKTPTLY